MAKTNLSETETKAAIYDLAEIANEYAQKQQAVLQQIQVLKGELDRIKAESEAPANGENL
jgi:cell division protein FtsB